MRIQLARATALFVVVLLLTAQAHAQSPDPGADAAARELITTIKLADQFKTMLPMIFKAMKPVIVQNRPDVERDFDELEPIAREKMGTRVGELMDAVVIVYSSNFSAQELRELTAFYRTPVGQKLLQKTPILTQQTMLAGQKFGQSVGAEARQEMLEGLRIRGHDL